MAATTRNVSVYVNGTPVITQIGVPSLVSSVVNRPISVMNPVRIPPGGSLSLVAVA